jgi:hypothetical protein
VINDAVLIGRSAEDVLSRTVRLSFGGREFTLPVLTIAGNRRWLARVDAELGRVLDGLRARGQTPDLLGVLNGQIDQMLDLLIAYDTSNVLPPRDELAELAYEPELLKAIQEVWRAANPLVAIALSRLHLEAVTSDSSAPTSSPPRPGAGRRRRSTAN